MLHAFLSAVVEIGMRKPDLALQAIYVYTVIVVLRCYLDLVGQISP